MFAYWSKISSLSVQIKKQNVFIKLNCLFLVLVVKMFFFKRVWQTRLGMVFLNISEIEYIVFAY